MSSVKSLSLGGEKDTEKNDGGGGEIMKMGYLKKLKTMRKKFFVLRGDCSEYSARLEYYDSEKKWKTHHSPKRCIVLKTCFNINRRLDTKHKFVIALYTKDDCFCLVLETEEDLEDWLKALLSLQHGEDVPDGVPPKPLFEHVWQVTVQKRGLGNSRNILGPHHLCLTDKTLSLVKMTQDEKPETYEFSLMSIRRCGHSECFFYMEVGRSSCTGAGDLWMQTEDPNIAENMHDAILSAMKTNSSKEDLPSRTRTRSSSSNESSKPISVVSRRQTLSGMGAKPAVYAASEDSVRSSHHSNLNRAHTLYSDGLSTLTTDSGLTAGSTAIRDRSDSMPSRPRTTSEGHHPLPLPYSARNTHLVPGLRPHSMYSRGISYSPPVGSSPVSPASGACSTDSAGSSLSIDDGDGWGDIVQDGSGALGRYGHSLTPDEPVILEENCDECLAWSNAAGEKCENYLPMDRSVTCLSLPIHPITTVSNSVVGSGLQRKFSPNLSSGFKSGSPSQSSYMEMYSPCSSSPMDPPGSCLAMSPVGGALPDGGARIMPYSRTTNSVNHSRGSSLAEETTDGYVSMAPGVMDDGYVDMDPIHHGPHQHLNDDFHHGEMSPASSCSITSGTPSTDLRFSEYHLEKVSSYLTPSEDDETSSLDRPIRAYSVGSRPDIKKINRLEICNQADAARVRAFSVGSRTGTGGKLTASRLLCHDLHSRYHTSSIGPTLTPPTHHHLQSTPSSYSKKSLSAPLLSNSWSGSSNFRHAHTNSSHSSIEPMDDLMEMDFSHHRSTRSNKTSSSSSKTTVKSKLDAALPPSGSLSNHDRSPMTYGGSSNSNGDTPRSLTKFSTVSGPYLEMKPTVSGDPHVTPLTGTKSTTVSPKTSVSSGPYEEMKSCAIGGELLVNRPVIPSLQSNASTAFNVGQEAASSSPPKRPTPGTSPKSSFVGSETSQLPFSSPKSIVCSGFGHAAEAEGAGPYLEMKPKGEAGGTHSQSFTAIVKHLSARKPTSPIQEEYMDMSLGRQPLEEENDVNCPLGSRTAPVDTPQAKKPHDTLWSVGSNKPPAKSSLEGFRPQVVHAEDDYMTVNYDGHGNRKKERKGSRKDRKDKTRYSSQPIAIQSSSLPKDPVLKTSSTSPIFSLSNLVNMSGRKHSSGTPPKIPPGFLPLDGSGYSASSPGSSPFSSLRRQRNRKRSNGGSRRESSDINSGVTTPTGSNVAIFPFSLNSPSSPMKPFPGPSIYGKVQNLDSSFESSSKCPVDATSGTVRISYPYSNLQQPVISPDSGGVTSESSSSSEQPTPVNLAACPDSEYVNYSPKQPSVSDQYDYTVMNPIPISSSNAVRKISAPLFGMSHVQQSLSSLSMSSPSLMEGKGETSLKSSLGFQPIAKPTEQTPPPKVITSCQSQSAMHQVAACFTKHVNSDRDYADMTGNRVEVQADERNKESITSCENSISSSRPPSVISERELHYASLDLASTGSKEGDDGSCSPHGIKSQSSLTESSTSSSSPNPSIAGLASGEAFTYAEIDFVKSEDLKNMARKTKH